VCAIAYIALHVLKEGYEVYGLIGAAGDSTPDAHKYGIWSQETVAGRSHPDYYRVAGVGMDA